MAGVAAGALVLSLLVLVLDAASAAGLALVVVLPVVDSVLGPLFPVDE